MTSERKQLFFDSDAFIWLGSTLQIFIQHRSDISYLVQLCRFEHVRQEYFLCQI